MSSESFFAKEKGDGPMMRQEEPTTAKKKEATCREMDCCLQVGWYSGWTAAVGMASGQLLETAIDGRLKCNLSKMWSRLDIRKANQVAIIHCTIVFYYRVILLLS